MSELKTTRTPATIAAEINIIKEQVRRTAVQAAIEIGQRLKEAKSLVPYGAWREWLETNVDYSERTAQNMMALADEYANKETKAIADLPVTKAVMLLGVPAEDREAFMQEHPVEDMSTRELKAEIEALKAENAKKQLTIDELMNAEPPESDEAMREELRAARDQARASEQEAISAQERYEAIKQSQADREAEYARMAQEAVKARERVAAMVKEKADWEAEHNKARERIADLEKERRDLMNEVAEVSERSVEYRDSAETLDKLERLKAEQEASEAVSGYKAGFELMRRGLDMMVAALEGMSGEVRQRYVSASVKALDIAREKLV